MNVDLKFGELTADVLQMFFIKYVYTCIYIYVFVFSTEKTHPHSILQVPTTQLAKMSIDPKFVELTIDVLEIFLLNTVFFTPRTLVGLSGGAFKLLVFFFW